MLDDFRASLKLEFPEAQLSLLEPVSSSTAFARFEEICATYLDIAGCKSELEERSAYGEYERELASILNIDPDETNRFLTLGLTAGALADLLVAEGSAHGLDAMDGFEAAVHGFDSLIALGFSVGLSFVIGSYFRKRHNGKREDIYSFAQRALLNGRLARALLSVAEVNIVGKVLDRLSGVTALQAGL